jgi:hypothetical protein
VKFVVDVQRGGDSLGEDASAEAAGGAAGHAPAEDELDLIGAANVEVFADDLFEEDAPGHELVEDLGESELRLQGWRRRSGNRPCGRRGYRVREAGEPLAGQCRDARGREPVAQGLGAARVGAGEHDLRVVAPPSGTLAQLAGSSDASIVGVPSPDQSSKYPPPLFCNLNALPSSASGLKMRIACPNERTAPTGYS